MKLPISFDALHLLPPTLHSLLLSWRSSNTSPFSLELEALYQLAPSSEWEQLAALLTHLEHDYDLLDLYVQHLLQGKPQIFFTKGNNLALTLRERLRKQIVAAYDGHFILHRQRHAFIWRRLHEPDIRDLELTDDEKIAKILEKLKPLASFERPLTIEERRFCQGLDLFFPYYPSDHSVLSPSTPNAPPTLPPTPDTSPELSTPSPFAFLRRRQPDASYSKLED